MHSGIERWGESILTSELVAGKRILDVGSRNLNGSLRAHIESLAPKEIVGVDFLEGDEVDVVMDAKDLVTKFGSEQWDIVISTEMLEHSKNWEEVLYQMKASLVEGGTLILTTRSPGFPKHDFPDDYWRFTVQTMRDALSDMHDVKVRNDPGYILEVDSDEDCQFHDETGLPMPHKHAWSAPGVFVTAKRKGPVSKIELTKAIPVAVETPAWGSYENMDPSLSDPSMRTIKVGGVKLDIGSGGPQYERKDYSWTTVDLFQPADIKADMGDLPFKDKEVLAIFSAHALEHIPFARIIPILTEWHRVLKSGGRLTLLVPDFDVIAKRWLDEGPRNTIGYVFGNQEHEGEFHKAAWNLTTLREDLETVGLYVEKIDSVYIEEYSQHTIWAESVRV